MRHFSHTDAISSQWRFCLFSQWRLINCDALFCFHCDANPFQSIRDKENILRHATSNRPLKQAGIYVTEDFSSKTKNVSKSGKVPGSPSKINPILAGVQQVIQTLANQTWAITTPGPNSMNSLQACISKDFTCSHKYVWFCYTNILLVFTKKFCKV